MSLTEIQNRLRVPKERENKFLNANYRNCEDILNAVKPLLKEFGYSLTLSDKVVSVGDRIYVEATATIKESGITIDSVSAYAREVKEKKGVDGSQLTGSASSYARKVALGGLFLLDDSADPDSMDNSVKPEEQITDKQAAALRDLVESKNFKDDTGKAVDVDASCARLAGSFKMKSLYDLSTSQYDTAVARIEQKAKDAFEKGV